MGLINDPELVLWCPLNEPSGAPLFKNYSVAYGNNPSGINYDLHVAVTVGSDAANIDTASRAWWPGTDQFLNPESGRLYTGYKVRGESDQILNNQGPNEKILILGHGGFASKLALAPPAVAQSGFTIGLWVNPQTDGAAGVAGLSNSNELLAEHHALLSRTDATVGWIIGVSGKQSQGSQFNSDPANFQLRAYAHVLQNSPHLSTPIESGAYTHLTLTYRFLGGANNEVVLYKDGRVADSGTTSQSLTRNTAAYLARVFSIGGSQTVAATTDTYRNATGWGHLISGVYGFNRVLPEGEILAMHETGGIQAENGPGYKEGKEIGLFDKKLLAYYPHISPSFIDVGSGHFNLIAERDVGSFNGANSYITLSPGPFNHGMPNINSSTQVAQAAGSGLLKELVRVKSFTIGGWFKINTAQSPLISLGATQSATLFNQGFFVESVASPNARIRARFFTDGNPNAATTLQSEDTNLWNYTHSHVALAYDDQTVGAALYVNGIQVQSGTLPHSIVPLLDGLASSGFPIIFCNAITSPGATFLNYTASIENAVGEGFVIGRPLLQAEINFLVQSGINISPVFYTVHDPRLRGYWKGSGLLTNDILIPDSARVFAGTAVPGHMTRIASDLEWDQVEASDTQSAFYRIDRFQKTSDYNLGITSGTYAVLGGSKGFHDIGGAFTSERMTGSSDLSKRYLVIDCDRDLSPPSYINELVWMFEVTPSGTIPRINEGGSSGREFNSLLVDYGNNTDRLCAFLTGANASLTGSGIAVVWTTRDGLDTTQAGLCSGNIPYGSTSKVLFRARPLLPNTAIGTPTASPIEFSAYINGIKVQTRVLTIQVSRFFSDIDNNTAGGDWILQVGGRAIDEEFDTQQTTFNGLGQNYIRNLGIMIGHFSQNDIDYLATSGIIDTPNYPGFINEEPQKRVDILDPGLVALWRFSGDTSGTLDISGRGNHLRHLAREAAEKNLFATQSNAAHNLRYVPGPFNQSPLFVKASGITYNNKTFTSPPTGNDAITPFAASGSAFSIPQSGFTLAIWMSQREAVAAADAQFIMGYGITPDAINNTTFQDASWSVIIDDENSVKMLLSLNGSMPYDNNSTTASVIKCGMLRTVTDRGANDIIEIFKEGSFTPGHLDALQHFAWSYDHNANTIKAYIDGALVDQRDVPASGFHNPTQLEARLISFLVPQSGVWAWGTNRAAFNAVISEVSYFNRPLTSSEVLYLATQGLGAGSGVVSGVIGGYIDGVDFGSGFIGGYTAALDYGSGFIGGQVSGVSGAIGSIGGWIEGEQRFGSGFIGGFISGVGDRPLNMHASFYLDADEWQGYEVLAYYTFKADQSAHGGVTLESLRDRASYNHLIPFHKAFGEQLFVPGARGALGSGLIFDGESDAWWRKKTILMAESGVTRGWDSSTQQQLRSNLGLKEATFGIWINPDQITETRGIAAIGSGITGSNWRPALNLYQEGPTVVARVNNDSVELRADDVLTAGQWTHVAITFDNDTSKVSDNLILYIDGIPAMARSKSSTLFINQQNPLFLLGTCLSGLPGSFPDPHPTLPYFKGAISETFFTIGILASGTPNATESGLLNITRNAGMFDAITESGVSLSIRDPFLAGLWRLSEVDTDLVTYRDTSLQGRHMVFVGNGTAPDIFNPGAQRDGTFGSGAFFRHDNKPGTQINTSLLLNDDTTAWDAIQAGGQMTVACWIMPTITAPKNTTGSFPNSFVFGRATDGASSINDEWYFSMNPSTDNNREDNIRLLLSDASTDRIVDVGFYDGYWSSQNFSTTTRENEMDTPQHLAMVANANIAYFFFNGHLLGYRQLVPPIDGASSDLVWLMLGAITDEQVGPFEDTTGYSGVIKDAVIFGRALTPLEIKALVRDGIPLRSAETGSGFIGGYIVGVDNNDVVTPLSNNFVQDNLLAYWKFNEFKDNAGYKDEVGALRISNLRGHPASGFPTASLALPVSINTNPVAMSPALGIVYSPRAIVTNQYTDFLGSLSGTAAPYWEDNSGHREFTLCFWYRPRGNSFDGNERGIIGLGEGGGATRFGVFHTQDDLKVFYGGGTGKTNQFNNTLQLNAWQFVSIVRQGSGITVSELPNEYGVAPGQTLFDYSYTTLFINGIPQGSGTFTSGVLGAFSPSRLRDAFILGNAFENNTTSSGVPDIADFAEISMWRRPLTGAQIRGLMLSGVNITLPRLNETDPDLLCLYRLHENDQATRINSASSPLATQTPLHLRVSGVGPGNGPHPNPPRLVGYESGVLGTLQQNRLGFRNHGYNHSPWNSFASDPLGLGGVSGSFVYIPYNEQSGVFDNLRSNFSFGGWIKLFDNSQLNSSILGRGARFQGPIHFRFRASSTVIVAEVQGNNTLNNYPLHPPKNDTDPSSPNTETFECHLAYVLDNDHKESRLYRDGILISAVRHDASDTAAISASGADGDFIIGHFPRMSPTNFSGILSDVFFINRVLDKDEIKSIVVYGWGTNPINSGCIGGLISGIDPGGQGHIGGYVNSQDIGSGFIGGFISGIVPGSGFIGGYINGMANGESYIGGYVSGIAGEGSGFIGGYILVSTLGSGFIGGWINPAQSGTLSFDGGFTISAFSAADFDSMVEIQKTSKADFDSQVYVYKDELPPACEIIIPETDLSGLAPPFNQYFIGRASGLQGKSITSARWTWGDFSPPTDTSESGNYLFPGFHRFQGSGYYFITFEVVDSAGVRNMDVMFINAASGIDPVLITVSGVPRSGFTPLTVQFTQTYEYIPPGVLISASLLNYGDGQFTANLNTRHVYTDPGHYIPIWQIRDSRGVIWSDSLEAGIDSLRI